MSVVEIIGVIGATVTAVAEGVIGVGSEVAVVVDGTVKILSGGALGVVSVTM